MFNYLVLSSMAMRVRWTGAPVLTRTFCASRSARVCILPIFRQSENFVETLSELIGSKLAIVACHDGVKRLDQGLFRIVVSLPTIHLVRILDQRINEGRVRGGSLSSDLESFVDEDQGMRKIIMIALEFSHISQKQRQHRMTRRQETLARARRFSSCRRARSTSLLL